MENYLRGLIALSLIISCASASDLSTINRVSQYQSLSNFTADSDHVKFALTNPLHTPLRISIQTNDLGLKVKFDTITLQPKSDTIFELRHSQKENLKLHLSESFGDLNKKITLEKLDLPFPKGKKYQVIQGYHEKFTHYKSEYSRYAIDFNLKEDDIVTSADTGFVVGVVDAYTVYGNDVKYQNFSNFITIYNPDSGIFTQYVHLKNGRIFVKVGDQVKRGQKLALTGLSGYMDGEHLHFNVLVPSKKDQLKSVPIEFKNYKGIELKKFDFVENN